MSPLQSSRRDPRPQGHQSAKLPLVYILSTGRSGSTLLDVLLGAQPECWTLGEFHLLDIGVGQEMPCGCHEQLSQCDFWGPIVERVRRTLRFPLGYFRSGRFPNGKVVRWSLLPSFLTGRPLAVHRPAAEAYGISNLAALDEANYAAGEYQERVTWMVDASKDPYRLLWLQASGHFDLRVIHLIRRPEGFVANMMRSAGASGIAAVIKYAGRWLVDNALGRILIWRLFRPETVRTVHYEDLATDANSVISDLCAWLEVPFEAERTEGTRFEINHGIAGNRPRWDDVTVNFEEAWRSTMSRSHQRLVWLLTSPLAFLRRRPKGGSGRSTRKATEAPTRTFPLAHQVDPTPNIKHR